MNKKTIIEVMKIIKGKQQINLLNDMKTNPYIIEDNGNVRFISDDVISSFNSKDEIDYFEMEDYLNENDEYRFYHGYTDNDYYEEYDDYEDNNFEKGFFGW